MRISNTQSVPYATTIHVRDHCLCLHTQRAARSLVRRFDAALKPLERRGWIAIAVDPGDKRGRLLILTPDGRRVLASAVPVWERTHDTVERGLPDAGHLRGDLTLVVGDFHHR